jgi:drug/metabolite transporter (DMT)-like permease
MPALTLQRLPARGLGYMVVAVFFFSAMDGSAKWLTADYHLIEIVFFSRVISPFFALAIATKHGGLASLHTRHIGWQFLRALVNGTTLLTFFGALIYLPLATTVAITFASPLFMCILAMPILGERVGPRRWVAIGVGFLGVLIITGPGIMGAGPSSTSGAGFGIGALLALGAAFCDALGITITRRMSGSESSHSMLFWSSIFLLVGFGAGLPGAWITPAGEDLVAIAVLAISASVAQFSLAQAFRYGEVSLLAPLEYSALVWATIFGYAFWHELPTLGVLIGVAIIVASSAYVAHHEARGKEA